MHGSSIQQNNQLQDIKSGRSKLAQQVERPKSVATLNTKTPTHTTKKSVQMMGKQSSIAKRLVEMSPLGGKHKRTKLQDLPMATEFLAWQTPAIVISTL
jgi:hypothetical protein